MSKEFWNSTSYLIIGLAAGYMIGTASHPYEECKSKYTSVEDITECVWILENEH